ncbi:MAG: hypothetical protein N0A16_08705 [Blastocatellia bacterium]|nr:hypothetical protein [Blastocatellia bacterium]MCS7157794.1 hypothetical protein [Blastocatellia bacterium]MCX7753307.1 hypothetical protein [Blastocatellia bacterium]MDW8168131.1 hypothetical protein [Acidobacteriota bacterium]MDW8257622.1 hypothetical protein [Acidobacteriota bacterium]
MAFTLKDFHDLVRILEEHPEWRAELRRLLLTDQLLELPTVVHELAEAQRRTEERVQALAEQVRELAEAQRRTEQQVAELAAAQQRTEQWVAELAAAQRQMEQQLAELAAAQRRTEQQVAELAAAQRQMQEQTAELAAAQRQMGQVLLQLVGWQQGEAGRREGERYERRTIARAPNLFLGGEGGAPSDPDVRRRLSQWLRPLYQQGQTPDPPADPFLADLLWWKEDEVLLVEISQKVDAQDIRRARQRADTLRAVGVKATPVVIGEEWATPESQVLAQAELVEWFVSGGSSQGFLRFRRLPFLPEEDGRE